MQGRFGLKLGHKLYAILALSFAGFLGITLFTVWELGQALSDQKSVELRHLTQLAVGIAEEEHAAAESGSITVESAKQRAAARIGELRYGDGDYFWINGLDGRMLMHPIKPDLNGTDVLGMTDPNGKPLFAEMIDVVESAGSGYVRYEWPKPGADAPQPKLSYVSGFAPWGWVIGTGVYVDDLSAQTWQTARLVFLFAGAVLLLTGAINATVARRVSGSISKMTSAMGELAGGNFEVILPGLDRSDEVGEMARAVEDFKAKAIEKAEREAREREAADHEAAAQRRAEMHRLADLFESAVGEVTAVVSSAAAELEASAGSMTETAGRTQELTGVVTNVSEQTSTNVRSIAAATEELGASVGEISRQVHESATIAGEAVSQATSTNQRMTRLAESADRIGTVVKLITDIAAQTNLLALNATIEAARAGEAGKGFAVVAQEVKVLAAQTAKATDEIVEQISAMQEATQESGQSMEAIGGTISRVSEIAEAVAAAVEEQYATTKDIGQNIQEAAQGTSEVSANILDVDRGAGETGAASSQVLASAQSLSKESARLKTEVETFLKTVRAA